MQLANLVLEDRYILADQNQDTLDKFAFAAATANVMLAKQLLQIRNTKLMH